MSTHEVKGYCPGALQPMQSGDGMVVRVRPFGGRLTQDQACGVASLSRTHGNGLLDLSSRANLQIRGVTEESYNALMDGLLALWLLDATAEIEARRNITVTPFWDAGDGTQDIAAALAEALAAPDALDLPPKFGFAVDTGETPVLRNTPADIRLERRAGGGLLVCADGAPVCRPVAEQDAVAEALELATWFLNERNGEKRMRTLVERDRALPQDHFVPLQEASFVATPGPMPNGVMAGFAFGQMTSGALAQLAELGGLRMTPWRMVLVENRDSLPNIDGVITDPADPLLRVTACTGAPVCSQALGDTRALARSLAKHLPDAQKLHISGCTKGCAHPKPAPLTITATAAGYDLIRNGRASDAPAQCGLTPATLIETF